MGARTLLVEKNGALGGTTTVAGVALPGLFHAWGQQIISGIGWELVRRAVDITAGTFPDFSQWQLPHFKLQVPVDPAIYACVLDEAVANSGVDLLLHSMVGDVEFRGDHWAVLLCLKEGLAPITASRLIDATGDADVVGRAGLERFVSTHRQPGTPMVRFGGYDPSALNFNALDSARTEAVREGALELSDMLVFDSPMRKFLNNRGENCIHIPGATGGSSAERTSAELAGRRAVLRIYEFLKRQPGLEGLTIDRWATETGIRESCTIDGIARITADDYVSGRRWPDGVSYSFYPIDIHSPDGDGVRIEPLEYGTFPTIPRGAMVPRENGHLVVAGRAVAGDQAANSAYRVQASCMAMGQAAGAMAVLAARNGTQIQDVPIDHIRDELYRSGAIVPERPGAPTADGSHSRATLAASSSRT
ncbi:FAD-dependent oxidoreductase [Tessaracoccus lubricantis]|uniref:FAD-dependent oxidoreductase n=2 Tax=Tessaracoccus lubricantis TaxID=545543 RepID=A0ABP9F1Y3_9ACTN